jgi:hypothetical protein
VSIATDVKRNQDDVQAVTWPLLAILASAVISAGLTGVNGMGLVYYLGYVVVYLVARRFPQAPLWLARWGGAVVAVACFGQGSQGGRPWNPNIMANYLLLALPFGHQAGMYWWLAGFYALYLTGSRGAWMAFVMAACTLYNFRIDDSGRLRSRLAWYTLAGAAVGIFALAVVLAALRPRTVVGVRWPEYLAAARAFWTTPLWGSGPWSHRVDNLPLTIAAEYGLLGLAAWAWLVAAVMRRVLSTRGNPARLAITAWLYHQLFDNTMWWFSATAMAISMIVLLYSPVAEIAEIKEVNVDGRSDEGLSSSVGARSPAGVGGVLSAGDGEVAG